MVTISREDYLKRVYLLQQEHDGAVSIGALATAMGVTPASTTGMVKSLADRGFIEHEPYKGVSLTSEGERQALDVIRRHRLLELFLVRTLGLDWSEVHEEAERLEHAVSDALLAKIDAFLGKPRVDPHGDPIPPAHGRIAPRATRSLADCAAGERVRITRVIDQGAAFLRFVDRSGLRPGVEVAVEGNDPESQVVRVRSGDGGPTALATRAAAKLLVEPV